MKALFRASRLMQIAGSKQITLTKTPSTSDDDFSGSQFPITVYGDSDFFKPNELYTVEISPVVTAEPEAVETNTAQLTETNNLNNTDMSIFTKIEDFFGNLIEKIKEEWEKLSPVIKTDVNAIITASQLLLSNLDKPASVVLSLIETAIGTFATGKIKSVLGTVVTDLGVIATDINDPVAILQDIINDFSAVTGNSLLDKAENFEKYLVQKLNPTEVDRVSAAQLVQYAKSTGIVAPIPATDTQANAGASTGEPTKEAAVVPGATDQQ